MTDPGAPPLNPTLQKLEAVLRGIEERVSHTRGCRRTYMEGGEQREWRDEDCDCDRPARVRAEQARTVEWMLEVVYQQAPGDTYSKAQDHDLVWAAALRAGEEPR